MSRGRNRRREGYNAQPLPGIVGMIEEAPFGPRWQEATRISKISEYLRNRCAIVRRDSHDVARRAQCWWVMVRCGDGMVRAFADESHANFWVKHKARACGGVVERFNIRWKKPIK